MKVNGLKFHANDLTVTCLYMESFLKQEPGGNRKIPVPRSFFEKAEGLQLD